MLQSAPAAQRERQKCALARAQAGVAVERAVGARHQRPGGECGKMRV